MARLFDFSVESRDMERVARELKVAADRKLRGHVNESLMKVSSPLLDLVRTRAEETLPHHGGLNRWVAGATYKAALRGGANPGVVLRGRSAGHDLRSIDRGFVRHPVFGTWRAGTPAEPVRPGFFTDTIHEHATEPMVRGILEAVTKTFDEVR